MIERDIQKNIDPWIDREEVIILSGPRQVGKTTLLRGYEMLLRDQGKQTLFVDLEYGSMLASVNDIERFVAGLDLSRKLYLFLDEIQYLDNPSHVLKFLYDAYRDRIKVFATGSAQLEIKAKLQDSLVGRKVTFSVTPFHWDEFLRLKWFKKSPFPEHDKIVLQGYLEEYLTYGGLPMVASTPDISIKQLLLREYVGTYVAKDVRSIVRIEDIAGFNKLIIALAKMIGNIKETSSLARDIRIAPQTLNRYLDILEQTFVYDFIYPYFNNPLTQIKKSQKVYIFDLWVRNSILSDFRETSLRDDMGALFENFVYLWLKDRHDAPIQYFRNTHGNELDFIVQEDGHIHGYEAKYSENTISSRRSYLAIRETLWLDTIHILYRGASQRSDDGRFEYENILK